MPSFLTLAFLYGGNFMTCETENFSYEGLDLFMSHLYPRVL